MSIRLRLAVWYALALGATLVLFSFLVYFVMERHLIAESDDSVTSRARQIASAVRVDTSTLPFRLLIELPPIDAFQSVGIYVQVVNLDGQIVAHSDNLGNQRLPIDRAPFERVAANGQGELYTTVISGEQVRVYLQPLGAAGRVAGFVQVGRTYGDAYATLDRLRLWLALAGGVSLLLALVAGWAIAGSALRPIARITRTAQDIALSRNFARRLDDTDSRDEVGQLGLTFNQMLESLEAAYAAQQRFIADASHELRTPLTAVRANLELLEKQGDRLPPRERTELAQAAAREAGRMARLVADLLSLARADAGQKLEMRPVELDRLILETLGETRLLTQSVTVAIGEIDQVAALGDADRLKQLLLILLDNAVRYTPAGGSVTVSLAKDEGQAVLKVADTGVGIGPEDLPQIFQRFYRADRGRNRAEKGTGLGLAIAKWIVEQHRGEIGVASVPGQGSTFEVRLPLG